MTDQYHYCVLTKAEAAHSVGAADSIDMENVDYKRQPDVTITENWIDQAGGLCCGIIRGGQFGLATNQIAVLSHWIDAESIDFNQLARQQSWQLSGLELLESTVRPLKPEKMELDGIYVIRWIRMQSSDIHEYTELCLQTWPRFEEITQSRCFGVFKPVKSSDISKILMLTWYATLTDWEQSRRLDPDDAPKWGRRSEMELSHWAEAGRLA